MRSLALALIVLVFLAACGSEPAKSAPIETDEQKTLYALGFVLARQMNGAQFDAAEVTVVQAGLADAMSGQSAQVPLELFGPKVNALMNARLAALATEEKQKSQEYCEQQAQTAGARKTTSGAIYIETAAGTGATPQPTDTVRLHYHGTLRDGTVFDSSVKKGKPMETRLNAVIPCFAEGVQQMKVGGKAKLVCPAETAYGDRGQPPVIRPGAALTFELELLEIVAAP